MPFLTDETADQLRRQGYAVLPNVQDTGNILVQAALISAVYPGRDRPGCRPITTMDVGAPITDATGLNTSATVEQVADELLRVASLRATA